MIFITGDCHGDVRKFSKEAFPEQNDLTRNDTVIICGDFGLIWGKEETKNENYWLNWLEDKNYTTVFVDGNHECFTRLNQYPVKKWNGGKVHEIRPHVLHLMRGEVFEIDGVKVFAFGGASSHDIDDGILDENDPDWKEKAKALEKNGKYYFRIKGLSWWEEELPSAKERLNGLKNLENHDYKVDLVISHCAPTFVQAYMSQGMFKPDLLTDYFQSLIYEKRLEYKHWFFGHYHDNKKVLDRFVLLFDQIVDVPISKQKSVLEENIEQNEL